jgi:hypothetical protein
MLVAFIFQISFQFGSIFFGLGPGLDGSLLGAISWESADCQPPWKNGSVFCNPKPPHAYVEECLDFQPRYTPLASPSVLQGWMEIDVLSVKASGEFNQLHHSA